MADVITCIICQKPIDNEHQSNVLGVKGSNGINTASQARGDNIIASQGDRVHTECRRSYCNLNVIKRDARSFQDDSTQKTPTRSLRSMEDSAFQFSNHCFFCGKTAKYSDKKRGPDVYPVRTLEFQKTVEQISNNRNDQWSNDVKGRLEFIRDLPAADAVYHQTCSVNFRTYKQIPAIFSPDKLQKKTCGRPKNERQLEAFKLVLHSLKEHPEEQVTVLNLVERMKALVGDDAFSAIYMKYKLKEYFGETILITDINGSANVVTFKSTASYILRDFYNLPRNNDTETEKKTLIETAAKLIQNDIKEIDSTKKTYPLTLDISSIKSNIDFVPGSLQQFLRLLFSEQDAELKIAAVGQAIIQASRPRTLIAPLQLGLGVQTHHQFGSRFLVDTLYSLGFCVSYGEIQKFEANAAQSGGTDIEGLTNGHAIQYIADNVDHNLRTLDGHDTFHGMGIIAGITPGTTRQTPIPRSDVSLDEVAKLGRLNIDFYKLHSNPLGSLKYEQLNLLDDVHASKTIDLLPTIIWPLNTCRQGWAATMQAVHDGKYPGQSSVVFLPMVDMNPGDISCIYSTIRFVCREARRHGCRPILTFDQPLYWKAMMIIENEPRESEVKNVILRLGAFHMEMSFLGCIGHLMGGSGLQEVLETVYAPTAISHMMTGKAVSRAVRGHFLVDTALYAILISNIYDTPLPSSPEDCSLIDNHEDSATCEQNLVHSEDHDNDLQAATRLYDLLVSGGITLESIENSDTLNIIQARLKEKMNSLSENRTAKLWLQYMDMVAILRRFIKAERMGDWNLHLVSVQQMLPYFAAAGHNLYTKSAYMYLQTMLSLEKTSPDVYNLFQSGHHVLRRSERYWAGLSTDLVIEQVLMRSVKSTGGLTRGRGMSEIQRAVWLLSMPACADINNAMQELCAVSYVTSDQHKESGKSRRERDRKDTENILGFLQTRNPFEGDVSLRNIETGETDDGKSNAETAKSTGNGIIQSMEGKHVSEYVFRKAEKAITLSTKSATTRTENEIFNVDPQLLFQRLVASVNGLDDISDLFRYELAAFPTSLFEASGLMRASQKSVLAEAIWNFGDCASAVPEIVHYVLDGGSLLHRLPWIKGLTFGSICKNYVEYVIKKYDKATIAFDGYSSGPSTKDATHLRRNGGSAGTRFDISSTSIFRSKKETFLSNQENKQTFIHMLAHSLEDSGCRVIHAADDADFLIVKEATETALNRTTVVIGEDTDLLVLLIFHTSLDFYNIYFHSVESSSRKLKIWDIHKTKELLGSDTCYHLPFLHAVTGCDTTSRVYGIGKSVALKKELRNDEHFKHQIQVFCSRLASVKDVVAAGENVIVSLYGGKPTEGLDTLRYKKFVDKVTCGKSCVQVQTLPPTSAAATYHSKRVYLQTQVWMGNDELIPEEWGWNLNNGILLPSKTDLPPAPENLIKIIRCTCKSNCDSKRCSCRKHGLECSQACKECHGFSCSNVQAIIEVDTDTDNEC